MAKSFAEVSSQPVRALQIWQILIACAHNRQTITYSHLAELMGYSDLRPTFAQLGHVMYYCYFNELPSLTALVVSEITGRANEEGLITVKDVDSEREKVFKHEWFKVFPPSIDELDRGYRSGEDLNKRGEIKRR
ncbi:MAG TPA: hypothetical protein VFS20_16755 [Longimicrobium sp.]|nr:hypothetical protein [Longimicrobium sp.]